MDLEELGILESVRLGLTPAASRVHASLDKLNLYTRDGVRATIHDNGDTMMEPRQ